MPITIDEVNMDVQPVAGGKQATATGAHRPGDADLADAMRAALEDEQRRLERLSAD